MLKTIIGKLEKKNNDMDAEVAQLKRNNNKCYISTFSYILVTNPRIASDNFLGKILFWSPNFVKKIFIISFIIIFMISYIKFLTIIIYLLVDDLHNIDIKWEVKLFIRFLKVMVYEDYIYIRLNEMSKIEIIKLFKRSLRSVTVKMVCIYCNYMFYSCLLGMQRLFLLLLKSYIFHHELLFTRFPLFGFLIF